MALPWTKTDPLREGHANWAGGRWVQDTSWCSRLSGNNWIYEIRKFKTTTTPQGSLHAGLCVGNMFIHVYSLNRFYCMLPRCRAPLWGFDKGSVWGRNSSGFWIKTQITHTGFAPALQSPALAHSDRLRNADNFFHPALLKGLSNWSERHSTILGTL